MDLAVIVLTYNEELHIERCIRSLSGLGGVRIYVVDSYSTDLTSQIAKGLGVKVFQNTFVNQAVQFQWAIDNCGIDTEWILRLDADEVIGSSLSSNIKKLIENDDGKFNGAIFHRKHYFLGKWIRYGGRYPLPMLRLFRNGTAHVEQRWMDEHIVLDKGESVYLEGEFSDINLNTVHWFIDKHNKYATREVIDLMLKKLLGDDALNITSQTGFAIRFKRFVKQKIYGRLPYFLRPSLYFVYRYFILLGFLDGVPGFAYHFMQGYWYRSLVDLKCIEVEKAWVGCENNLEKIEVLERITGYELGGYK